MNRPCPGDGCTKVIPPGLLMCPECRQLEARIAQAAAKELAEFDHLLAAHAAFDQWLIDHKEDQ